MITSTGMLLTLVAALALAEPPLPDRPDRKPAAERPAPVFAPPPGAAPAGDAAAEPGPPPTPSPAEPRTSAPRSAPTDDGARIASPNRPTGGRLPPPPVTLAGAGALGAGGAAWLTEVGYPTLAITYGQGLNAVDDVGGTARFSWTTGEMLLGALWRRELWRDGSRLAFRLAGGPWFDFGATWIYPENGYNVGIEASPGLAWTTPAGQGLASVTLDLPLTWAWLRGMGVVVAPRLGASYEVPIGPDVTLGARAQLWVRWGGGSADVPDLDSKIQGALSALVTWRVF